MTDSLALEHFASTGDPAAFAHLVNRYRQMVYATCLRTLKNPCDAEDAAQDTFVILAKHAAAIRSNLGAWLHRTAKNVSISQMRSAARRRKREAAVARRNAVAAADEPLARSEIRGMAHEALDELPEAPRTLIVEHYLLGQTQTSMAAACGVSTATISRKMSRALETLRQRLRDKGYATCVGC